MRINATATPTAGPPYEIVTKPVDALRWEAATKKKITGGLGYTETAQLLHYAARRQELIPPDLAFPDWLEGLDDLQPHAEDPPQPQPDPSAE